MSVVFQSARSLLTSPSAAARLYEIRLALGGHFVPAAQRIEHSQIRRGRCVVLKTLHLLKCKSPRRPTGSASVSAEAAVRAALTILEGPMLVLPHGVRRRQKQCLWPRRAPRRRRGCAGCQAEPSNLAVTTLALVGLPKFKGITVTLKSLFPDSDLAVALANLRLASAEDIRAALDDPASDLAVATSRVAAEHAQYTAVRDAAVAAANPEQDARVTRVEAPGPDDALLVPAGPRCTARAPASSARRRMSLC
jgi:hypothetical protein